MSDTLSVLTYNIHKGFAIRNKAFTLHPIKNALADLQSTLIFLQEVQGEHQKKQKKIAEWPDEAQFEFIADELWPHYAYGKNAIYQGAQFLFKFFALFEQDAKSRLRLLLYSAHIMKKAALSPRLVHKCHPQQKQQTTKANKVL